jgi:hypothetical protein
VSRQRTAGTDDAGRPIVAELGRPETPDEIADRKAEASARRRSNQTTVNLVLALLASLAVVALVVLVVVRPQQIERDPVDYRAVAVDAQGEVDVPLAAPVLPDGWSANRAELKPAGADGVQSWQVGFLTPSGQYIGLVQGIDANATWVGDQTGDHEATDSILIDGIDWNVYDRTDTDDPGNLAYALVATLDRSTVVLAGTATHDEFATLAAAVATELGS